MVATTDVMRKDLDQTYLKTITYIQKSTNIVDLTTQDTDINNTTEYSIVCNYTIQNNRTQFNAEGTLLVGDLIGVFRYEYTQEANGTTISPTLIGKKGDVLRRSDGIQYVIKDVTPVLSPQGEIICYDFTATQTNEV